MNFRQNAYLLFLHVAKNEAAGEALNGRRDAAAALLRLANIFKELFAKQIKEARHELLLSKMQAEIKNGVGEAQRDLPALSEQYDGLMAQALREINAVCGGAAAKHG